MDNLCCSGDKRRQMTVACWFSWVGLPGEWARALLILSSLAMRMNVRHYAWSAMTTIFALRKCWRILKSHALTESAALRFSSPKSLFSPHPCRSRFSFLLLHPPTPPLFFLSAFCLFIWEYDLSWWLREEIEKKMFTSGKKKKMSLTCLNVFF